jgi:hypothetical protein
MLVILLAVPFGLWNVIAGFLGARSYMPSSFWVYLCECASILLPTFFFIILYDFFKNNERSWPAFAKGLVCLLLIVPCTNYVIQDISKARLSEQNFALWEQSVLAACQAISKDSALPKGDGIIDERAWKAINGRFETADRAQLLGLTPEKRSEDVRLIALIGETYRGVGSYTVEGKSSQPRSFNHIPAVQYTWNVSICDLAANRIISAQEIVGPMPPAVIEVSGDVVNPTVSGIKPLVEYQAWIESRSSSHNPTTSEKADNSQGQPLLADGICWTFELKNFDGNRSQVWDTVLDGNTKKLLQYNQFLSAIVLQNPQLKDDGYVFDSQKTYRLPELCH